MINQMKSYLFLESIPLIIHLLKVLLQLLRVDSLQRRPHQPLADLVAMRHVLAQRLQGSPLEFGEVFLLGADLLDFG